MVGLALLLGSASVSYSQTPDLYRLEASAVAADSARPGLFANTAIDIVSHASAIWLATGKGIQVSRDGGATWAIYDNSNGLVASSVSALASIDGRLWTGLTRTQVVDGRLFPFSEGVSFTDDEMTWTQIDFSDADQDIPFVIGVNRTVFDVTGVNDILGSDWVFFASFAGGLLASQDGGVNWRRIYASSSDSVQFNAGGPPSLRNRLFSAVVDTSHGDSLFLWTGTAAGVFQFVYAPPRDKLFQSRFAAFAATDSGVVIGGDAGVSRGALTGLPFDTRFATDPLTGGSDGLRDGSVSSLFAIDDVVLVGSVDGTGASLGLSRSVNSGDVYGPISNVDFEGAGRAVNDMEWFQDRLYLAASESGLQVSSDTGQTFTRILVDSVTPSLPWNNIYGLTSLGDTLWLGTDSGVVTLYLSPAGAIDSTVRAPFLETDTSSQRVIDLAAHEYIVGVIPPPDTLTPPDTVRNEAVWAVTVPTSVIGLPSLQVSLDGGRTWEVRTVPEPRSLVAVNDSLYVGTVTGVRKVVDPEEDENRVVDVVDLNDASLSLNADTVEALLFIPGSNLIWATAAGKLAVTTPTDVEWQIYTANFDSLRADRISNFNTINTVFGLPGDFVPALDIHYRSSGGPADIWVSGRPVDIGGNGVARGTWDDGGPFPQWNVVYDQNFMWNAGTLDDSTHLLATDDGLLLGFDTLVFFTDTAGTDSVRLVNWDTVPFEAANGDLLVDPGTSVFAVEAIDTSVWVGTSDGTIQISRATIADMRPVQRLVGVVDSTTPDDEVYAFPVPFSPSSGQTVDFRFVVDDDGPVTIEIYDFAMNLVARPIDNVFYAAGIYPSGSVPGRTWDGRNGKGELVAVGVYYFKVEQSNGEIRWGKLAVLP